ncbi:hypothetical protein [Catenovulum sediminis]|uniref:Solute-binding protein family 3/N-terminal domain-containing protein n=1 Tax=Catenovulum sediminis TaxID=1740262 RepID=A0ABV1RKY4_9ALTE|nr:hypothetical protein [Catenovulum sediminis]
MNKIIFACMLIISSMASANTTYTLQASFDGDTKDSYEYQVLKLALDKTIDDYGSYQLDITATAVPPSRYIVEANANSHTNFIFVNSVSEDALTQLSYAKFPVLLGIVGYRVPLVSSSLKSRGYRISNRQELMNFSMIQGKGWLDTDILKDNGFTVYSGKFVEGLFHMVANERGDFFPIGASQISSALENFSHVDGLAIDDQVMLYYPLPRFFFMGASHQAKIKRIEYGLIKAYQDKSLQILWNKHFKQALDAINISDRKLFKFRNNYINGVDTSYEKYVFDPFAQDN